MRSNVFSFSALRLVHRTLFTGQLVFLAVLYFIVYRKIALPPFVEYDKLMQVTCLLFSAVAFFTGNIVFKKKMTGIKDDQGITVKGKFEKYRAACMAQWAFLEAAVLFCGICFLFTGNYSFLALALLLMGIFFMLGPGKMKTILQIGISPAEAEEL
jgi:hypothetical protein